MPQHNKSLWVVIVVNRPHPHKLNEMQEVIEIIPIPKTDSTKEWDTIAYETYGYKKHFYIYATNNKEAKEIAKNRLDHKTFWTTND